MIPLIMRLELAGRRHAIRLWLPLFLIWLLLLPILLLMLPFAIVAMLFLPIRPFRALGAFLDVLEGFCGTHLEIALPDQSVLIHIY